MVDVFVHTRGKFKHSTQVSCDSQVWRVGGSNMQVNAATEGAAHTRPGTRTPLPHLQQFLTVASVVEVDAWEGTGNGNGVGAGCAIGTSVAGRSCRNFIDAVIVTVHVVAIPSTSDGNGKASGVTGTWVIGFYDHDKSVGSVGINLRH